MADGSVAPDHKTIADFRKDNSGAIRQVCARFIMLCRRLDLFADVSVAIDGSKFKAVNNRDRNFTRAKMNGGWRRSGERRALSKSTRQRRSGGPPRSARPRRPGSRRRLQS